MQTAAATRGSNSVIFFRLGGIMAALSVFSLSVQKNSHTVKKTGAVCDNSTRAQIKSLQTVRT
jgi:hypothetical protein